MIPAPRRMPLQPYSPNVPVFWGMKGCQLSVLMYAAPKPMKSSSTSTFTMTIAALAPADSRMPITRSAVTATTTSTAGRLNSAVTVPPLASAMLAPVGPVSCGGIDSPTSLSSETTSPDHPTATVDALNEYSRMRSQPMIQAKISPSVAYAYVYALPATGIMLANSA